MVTHLLDRLDIPHVQYAENIPSDGIKLSKKIMKTINKSKINDLHLKIDRSLSSYINKSQAIQILEENGEDYICVIFSVSSGFLHKTLLFLSEI